MHVECAKLDFIAFASAAFESPSVLNLVPAFCTQCRSRCGCIAVVENGRLTAVEPDPTHPTGAKPKRSARYK